MGLKKNKTKIKQNKKKQTKQNKTKQQQKQTEVLNNIAVIGYRINSPGVV